MGKIPGCGPRPALAAACALALCLVPSVANADVTVALQTRLATTSVTQQVPVLVTLRDQVDAARFAGHPAALIAALHREARRSSHQVPLVGPQRVRHFWLVNAVALSASPTQIATDRPRPGCCERRSRHHGPRRRRRDAGRGPEDRGHGRLGSRRHRRTLRLGRLRDHRQGRADRRHRHGCRPVGPRSGRQDRRLARLRERTARPRTTTAATAPTSRARSSAAPPAAPPSASHPAPRSSSPRRSTPRASATGARSSLPHSG